MENKKPFDMKTFIKKEGLTGARLKSLGLPRDLNLSSANKGPKKVYTPNLNVVRNKDKKKEIIRNKIEEARRQRQQRVRPKHEHQQISHSTGVFSDGFHSTFGPSTSLKGQGQSYQGGEPSSVMDVPKISKGPWTVDQSEEALIIDRLLNNYSDSGSEDDNDTLAPVCLNYEVKREIKSEQDSDFRKGQDYGNNDKNANFLVTYEFNRVGFLDTDLDDENPHVFLLKMPESLSGKYFAEEADDKNKDYRICDMHEGEVGKLVIRRSGKMEMQIGDVTYDLNEDCEARSSEDIVCTPENPQEHSLIKLHNVKERLLMMPRWDSIMKPKTSPYL